MESGKSTESDLVLLRHELKELTIMKEQGYTYEEAHTIANKDFPWSTMVKKEDE
jgi:hypothetical protein